MIKRLIDGWRQKFDEEPLFTLAVTYLGTCIAAMLFVLTVLIPLSVIFSDDSNQCPTQGELR